MHNKSLDASGTSGLVIDNLSVTWLSPAASTQPFDISLMETEGINSRLRFTVRWSPLLLAPAVVWLYLCWRHQPVSVAYVVACVGVGLLCGGLFIMDYWKSQYPLLTILALMIYFSAPMLLGLFFPRLDAIMAGKISYQYMS